MPPVYLYVVRDDSSDKPQEENKSTDANNGAPAAPEKPTGSNAGLIAGSITSVAVVIFLLIVSSFGVVKNQQRRARRSVACKDLLLLLPAFKRPQNSLQYAQVLAIHSG